MHFSITLIIFILLQVSYFYTKYNLFKTVGHIFYGDGSH